MTIEYTAAPAQSYQAYLAEHYLKQNIDIAVAKDIRVLVGTVDDIFKRNTQALTDALKDFRYFMSGPNAHFEVISVNLWNICNSLGALNANVVNGFQALFVKPDEAGATLLHLGTNEASDEPLDHAVDTDPCPAALDLIRRERFSEALALLGADEQPRAFKDGHRIDQLRGLLLSGVPGQPKSAALVDLQAAEEAFLAAASSTREARPVHAMQAYLAAGRAAYAASRFSDAERHYLAALDIDPICGEANYQMARLLVHDGRSASARLHFRLALDLHWSFALRAASDELFMARRRFVRSCLRVVTRQVRREARAISRTCVSDLNFLRRRQDSQYRLERIASLAPVSLAVADVSRMPRPVALKSAFDFRKTVKAVQTDVQRLAKDYGNLLRAAEYDITRRFVRRPLRRTVRELAFPLVAVVTAVVDLSVIVSIAAGVNVLAAPDTGLDWLVRAVVALSGLTCAFVAGCQPRARMETQLYRLFVPPMAAIQARAIELQLRGNRLAISFGQAALRHRLQGIERRFAPANRREGRSATPAHLR